MECGQGEMMDAVLYNIGLTILTVVVIGAIKVLEGLLK